MVTVFIFATYPVLQYLWSIDTTGEIKFLSHTTLLRECNLPFVPLSVKYFSTELILAFKISVLLNLDCVRP